MYLSYSGWKKYKDCAYSYWNGYLNKTATTGPDDRLGSIFGSVVGKLFEHFYNDQLYRKEQPQGEVLALVDATIKKIIRQETTPGGWKSAGVIMWKGKGEGLNPKGLYANVDDLAADVRDAVARGFRIIRHYRLLGQGAQAEVQLDSVVDGHKLGGRADFTMRRVKPHNDEVILDGKGSKWREAYVDARQLKWYAMLFRQKHGRLPERLGFVFWRFDPPESVDWLEVTEAETDALLAEVLGDIRQIEELSAGLDASSSFEVARKVFLPIADRPGIQRKDAEQACRFCAFATEEICPGGAKVVKEIGRR